MIAAPAAARTPAVPPFVGTLIQAPARLLDDVAAIALNLRRIADAAEGLRGEVRELQDGVEGLQRSFGRSSDEIRALREALAPQVAGLEDDLSDVRETVEPLQGAAERVGRAVERFPGPGRKRS